MTLSGTSTGTATTDANGNYSFTGAINGNYVPTPSKSGYSFTSVSTLVTINNADVKSQNFIGTATPATTYSISGTIALSGVGQSGVIVALTGTSNGAVVTNSSGYYIFTGLASGSYTVTPMAGSYTYPGTSLSVTITTANATGKNFSDRWFANNDGTITDMVTGLVWLKDANCLETAGGIDKASGNLVWADAQTWAAGLASGTCSLTDGSTAGNWRVPTKDELIAVTSGTLPVLSGTPRLFSNVQGYFYWSSSSVDPVNACFVNMINGFVSIDDKGSHSYVWPVRRGQ